MCSTQYRRQSRIIRRTTGSLPLIVLPQPVSSTYFAGFAAIENVVRRIVEAAERERRPRLVAFGRVIEHHVENHFDAGPVQRLHQVAELVHRREHVGLRAVRAVRREPGDRLVAPVVRAVGCGLGVELLHRHQLDRLDAEVDEIRNLLDEPGVGAALGRRDARVWVPREPGHVHLVDHRIDKRPLERRVALPVVVRADRPRRSSWRRPRCRPAPPPSRGRSSRCSPRPARTDRPAASRDRTASPAAGLFGPRNAVAVELPRSDARHEHVPVVVGAILLRVERDRLRRPRIVRRDRTAAARPRVACFE